MITQNQNELDPNSDSKTNFLHSQPENVMILLDNKKLSEKTNSTKKDNNEGMIVEEAVKINNYTEVKKINYANLILDVDDEFLVKEEDYDANLDLDDEKVIQNLKKEIDTLHPRKNENGKLTLYPVCGSSTGCIGCCSNFSKSDLEPEGQGIVFYFKFIKSLTLIFFLISVIYSPLYYVYIQNNKEMKIGDYKDALFLTTIGNMGSTLYNCHKYPVTEIESLETFTFHLDCKDSNVSFVTNFGLSEVYQEDLLNQQVCQNFTSYTNLKINSSCSLQENFNDLTIANCVGKSKCSFEVNLQSITDNCNVAAKHSYYYFSYTCYKPNIKIEDIEFSRETFSYIVVGVDIFSIVILFTGLMIITFSKLNSETYFKNNVIEISDYTLHFEKLNLDGLLINQELSELIEHLNKVYSELNPNRKTNFEEKGIENVIYDINYPLINDEKYKIFNERLRLNQSIRNLKKIAQNDKYNEKKELDVKLEKLNVLRSQLDGQLINKEMTKINDIYITFYNQDIAAIIYNAYKSRSSCARCCSLFFCQSKKLNFLYFRNRWLKVKTADQPSNIKWLNVPFSPCGRFLLKIVSIFVSLILIFSIFGMVIGEKVAQMKIGEKYNTDLDCDYATFKSDQEVLEEFLDETIEMKNKVKVYCYCYNKLINHGISDAFNAIIKQENKNHKPCEWIAEWTTVQGLKIGTIVLVSFVNILLSVTIQYFTKLERNKSESINMTSNMWKSFFIQFINMGVIILVVKMRIDEVKDCCSDFLIFTGKYSELDPTWYADVGTTIIFYMTLNIFTPHIGPFLHYFIAQCKRCSDKSGKKFTSKKTRKEFINLHVGPNYGMGTRYAQILSTIFVVLLYSSGIPILYACCFLFFLTTYFVDKFLILRFYRKTPNVKFNMTKSFNTLIIIAIILHYIFAIWIYGDKDILTNKSISTLYEFSYSVKSFLNNLTTNNFLSDFITRATYPYNILCLITLCSMIICLIVKIFFMDLIFSKCSLCKKEKTDTVKNVLEALPIRAIYKNYQIRKCQYKKLICKPNREEKFSYLSDTYKTTYLENNMMKERTEILNKLAVINALNSSLKSTDDNFDQEISQIWKNLEDEIKNKDADIKGESSYSITNIYDFRDESYYEYFLPFISNTY